MLLSITIVTHHPPSMAHIEIKLHKLEERKNNFDILNKILGKIKMIIECIGNIITTLPNLLRGIQVAPLPLAIGKAGDYCVNSNWYLHIEGTGTGLFLASLMNQTYSSSTLPETCKSLVTSNGLIYLVHFDLKYSASLFSLSPTSCLGILAPDT